jgi:Ulp1 family protease
LFLSKNQLDAILETQSRNARNRLATQKHQAPDDIEFIAAKKARRDESKEQARVHGKVTVAPDSVIRRNSEVNELSSRNRIPITRNMKTAAESSTNTKTSVVSLEDASQDDESFPAVYEITRPGTRSSARSQAGQKKPQQRERSPERWTEANPDWKSKYPWPSSLLYPFTDVRKKATVDLQDISRLDEGEFLNDNLIDFSLRFLEHDLHTEHPDIARRVYFQNTFFYTKLTKAPVRSNGINYDDVKRWTAKIDIFSYDYIIVPVNEKMHWYLAIICNPSRLLHPVENDEQTLQSVDCPTSSTSARKGFREAQTTEEMNTTSALKTKNSSDSMSQGVEHMSLDDNSKPGRQLSPGQLLHKTVFPTDMFGEASTSVDLTEEPSTSTASLKNASKISLKGKKLKRKSSVRKVAVGECRILTLDSLGLTHSPAALNLKAYLKCEAKERQQVDIADQSLTFTVKNLPEQNNYCDCGIFLVAYVARFLKNPDEFTQLAFEGAINVERHFPDMNASVMRTELRDRLFSLRNEQARIDDLALKAKRAARRAAKENGVGLVVANGQPGSSNASSTVPSPSRDFSDAVDSGLSEVRRQGRALSQEPVSDEPVQQDSRTSPTLPDVEQPLAEAPQYELDGSDEVEYVTSGPSHRFQGPENKYQAPGITPKASPKVRRIKVALEETLADELARTGIVSSPVQPPIKASARTSSRTNPFRRYATPKAQNGTETITTGVEVADSDDGSQSPKGASLMLESEREDRGEDFVDLLETEKETTLSYEPETGPRARTPTTTTPVATRTSPRIQRYIGQRPPFNQAQLASSTLIQKMGIPKMPSRES